jgi:AAA15 family ATPase/GTPase
VIGGEVIYENDSFYIAKEGLGRIQFALEASGYRKFGLLWKLIRNGLLESGGVLFWDEPENSLNPELVPVLVDILLELSRNGVQIFIATHSEILSEYFAVNRQKNDEVMFYSLYKTDGQIKVDSNDRFDLLNPNKLIDEPVRLYEKRLDRVFGDE